MKKLTILFLLASNFSIIIAQDINAKNIDGAYTALFEEIGATGFSKDKIIQLTEKNGTQMLAIAACEKCFPAIYTYNKALSQQFKKPVFANSIGLYVICYSEHSFVIVMPDLTFKENFSYLNFYSKNKAEVAKMTKVKIDDYASKILDYL